MLLSSANAAAGAVGDGAAEDAEGELRLPLPPPPPRLAGGAASLTAYRGWSLGLDGEGIGSRRSCC
jgi:hypothetical protein